MPRKFYYRERYIVLLADMCGEKKTYVGFIYYEEDIDSANARLQEQPLWQLCHFGIIKTNEHEPHG